MKRYQCYRFPALNGDVWYTNSWLRVRLWIFIRYHLLLEISEFRVVDSATGKHYVW